MTPRQGAHNIELRRELQSWPVTANCELSMNKSDLAKAVYNVHGGISFADAQRVVESMFEIIKTRLSRGEKVLISGFGTFSVVTRKDRLGVNPQTGEPVLIRGRKAISFRPSKSLKSV